MLNDGVAQVGVWLGAVIEAALFNQANIWQLSHDLWVLGAQALDKSSRAVLSHCVVDSSIENIVYDDVGADTMMALVALPAETVNEVDGHFGKFCVLVVVILVSGTGNRMYDRQIVSCSWCLWRPDD